MPARSLRVIAVIAALAVVVGTGVAWGKIRSFESGINHISPIALGDGGEDGAIDILLVGLDSRTDAAGNPLPRELFDALDVGPDQGTLNTDTVILVRIPDEAGLPTTAVSIPRDSYVTIPGFGTHKINSAYARAAAAARTRLASQGVTGAALERQAAQAGRRTLIATVEELTGASVDHYAEVNLAGFAEITQAVGGVPVCLNAAVRDPYSGADFPAGPQTVEGPAALAFVRQRHGLPRGDLDRVVRQQAFLASFAHEVLSTGTLADPAQLSGLIAAIGRYVVVDPGWDLLAFAAQARGLTAGAISFRTIPTERPNLPTPDDGVAVEVDPGAVRDFVATLSEGTPVGAPPAHTEAAAPAGDEGTPAPPPSPAPAVPAPAAAPITAAGVRCVN
jgi:LCP family protein required for cell wall assembly